MLAKIFNSFLFLRLLILVTTFLYHSFVLTNLKYELYGI